MQITEAINCTTQLEKESNISDLNDHQLSVSEQNRNHYSIVTLPTTVLYLESNAEQLNNINVAVTENINPVPQSMIALIDDEEEKGMSIKQLFLLKQQLTQHVQLITQHYILCANEKSYKVLRRKLKNMLVNSNL